MGSSPAWSPRAPPRTSGKPSAAPWGLWRSTSRPMPAMTCCKGRRPESKRRALNTRTILQRKAARPFANRVGYYFRVPAGVVAAIAPFNDPLAVAAHKIGPALAAGNAVILKPSPATPSSALHLARDLMEAGLPEGRLSVITGQDLEVGQPLVLDPRVRVVSFTGGIET